MNATNWSQANGIFCLYDLHTNSLRRGGYYLHTGTAVDHFTILFEIKIPDMDVYSSFDIFGVMILSFCCLFNALPKSCQRSCDVSAEKSNKFTHREHEQIFQSSPAQRTFGLATIATDGTIPASPEGVFFPYLRPDWRRSRQLTIRLS